MKLVIGDHNYSSWSLRPWLALKQAGVPFTEVGVRLYANDTRDQILKHSPSGKVPCLIDGDTVVWDSLAICEYAAEAVPTLWPVDRARRAEARAISAEMHSGFMALRKECSMTPDHSMVGPDRSPPPVGEAAAADIRRLVQIFREARARFGAGGDFLYGDWSIADAFFTPVAARVRHYQIDLSAHGDDGTAVAYVAALLDQPHFREWVAAALSSNVD